MVNFPQGGLSLHSPGRGSAPGAGSARATAAAERSEGPAANRVARPLTVTSPPPAAGPAKGAGGTAWSPARLIATLLRVLSAASASEGTEPGPRPRAGSSAGQVQGDPATQAPAPARSQLVAALLRLLAGAPSPRPAAPVSPAPGSRPEQAVERPPAMPQPLGLQEAATAGARIDGPATPAPVAAAPGSADAPAAPGEHPAPRAELVPPGDGVRGREGVDLPIVPAALVALALPALAAVLASIF